MTTREPIDVDAPTDEREARYEAVRRDIRAILEDESDWVAAMATVACELHHAFEFYDWTGFYRRVVDQELCVGPYQGTHGCLRITFDRGICGAAARRRETELVDDVTARPDHIACSSSTQSEIVVPVFGPDREVRAVLDVDSDTPAAFGETDREHLEGLCAWLGRQFCE